MGLQMSKCPECDKLVHSEGFAIHKIMCRRAKQIRIVIEQTQNKMAAQMIKMIMEINRQQKEKQQKVENKKEEKREKRQKEEEVMIPCMDCGENVEFSLYSLHEQECIGHQMITCRYCGVKYPTFLIREHNPVCPNKPQIVNNAFEQLHQQQRKEQEQQHYDVQQQEQRINPLVGLIEHLAVAQEKAEAEGLTINQLESLPKYFVVKEEDCAICCTSMRKMQRTIKLHCRHVFHRVCINPWLTKNPLCPMCRKHALSKKP